ncbi:hypothetical protein DTO027I6_512 [Penicillium roqueforti]|nr:uncharacterized protein LCP9604111_5317 [Penicillium roqueforti]KAF9248567.1 hypothetical protein LCP9604111_5317 [Penicillium roqueforti]KAI1832195.1 hypothetical protein CBS147337_6875 [Penicillium roqueforti]KAI2730239.1 hypothetical protein CBS147332_2091 [Penicillium roqueforti]KAI3112438.1 hypothetical protein CBS147333_3868 [Penicillium roqueforti]KAI3153612.1 hypothetical protein CBS147317_6420 [Penicillium roqueforti]
MMSTLMVDGRHGSHRPCTSLTPAYLKSRPWTGAYRNHYRYPRRQFFLRHNSARVTFHRVPPRGIVAFTLSPVSEHPILSLSIATFCISTVTMGLFDKLQAKLELYRLEQRYARRKHRSNFSTGAQYVDGEYVYTGPSSPTSTGSSKQSTASWRPSGWSGQSQASR